MENTEDNCEKISKIWMKCEMIWKKSKLKSEKIWKIWKKGKLYREMIWKIWKISVLVIITPRETSSSFPPTIFLLLLPLCIVFVVVANLFKKCNY
jgi:hypothetical protein